MLLARSKTIVRTNLGTLHHISRRNIAQIATLKSWQLQGFREQAFEPELPIVLPHSAEHTPLACKRWFNTCRPSLKDEADVASAPTQLNRGYFAPYENVVVPLEITQRSSESCSHVKFEKIEAPLRLLLDDLSSVSDQSTSIYLAQHDIRDLPKQLQDDLRMPSLVAAAGKGDVYSSSLWIGKAPTYTPLHRDPNPNLFVQIAGVKSIRMFRPEVGSAVFDLTQRLLQDKNQNSSSQSSAFRGHEMMGGPERQLLHDLVWTKPNQVDEQYADRILQHAYDATLQPGEALFIPKGWWHSVVGVGDDITASANWWFR